MDQDRRHRGVRRPDPPHPVAAGGSVAMAETDSSGRRAGYCRQRSRQSPAPAGPGWTQPDPGAVLARGRSGATARPGVHGPQRQPDDHQARDITAMRCAHVPQSAITTLARSSRGRPDDPEGPPARLGTRTSREPAITRGLGDSAPDVHEVVAGSGATSREGRRRPDRLAGRRSATGAAIGPAPSTHRHRRPRRRQAEPSCARGRFGGVRSEPVVEPVPGLECDRSRCGARARCEDFPSGGTSRVRAQRRCRPGGCRGRSRAGPARR